MERCLSCGRDAEYTFRMLEVQTLPVRDLGGEKKVQALGRFREEAICRTCAAAYRDAVMKPRSRLIRKLLPFLGVLLFGVLMLTLFLRGPRALTICGAAGVICGILGLFTGIRETLTLRKAYVSLSEEEALRRAAWERLLEKLPKKDGDNDLSYIPETPETLKLKNGDLMVVYHLLPAIAKKAWTMLREDADLQGGGG